MAYHGDLLGLAMEVFGKDNPTQADLRRAVSTAYYAFPSPHQRNDWQLEPRQLT